MKKIMFVCHGNICRSPMAEFVFKALVKERGLQDDLYIASSATSYEAVGCDVHSKTKAVLDTFGIPYERRRAVRLTADDYKEFDLIIGMDSANVRNIIRTFGGDEDKKVFKLLDFTANPADVDDPWYTGDFDKTYEDINRGLHGLLQYLGY